MQIIKINFKSIKLGSQWLDKGNTKDSYTSAIGQIIVSFCSSKDKNTNTQNKKSQNFYPFPNYENFENEIGAHWFRY